MDRLMVYADKAMVDTVLRNLLSNAIKYSKKGGTVNIAVEKHNDEVTFSVQDQGIGMEPQKADNLFVPSIMQSAPGTEGEKGTGTGLKICRAFVELNNGQIWAESKKGAGSKVCFTLPPA